MSANTISLTGDAAIVRGADYAFGIIPRAIIAPATTPSPVWPLTNCSLSAILYKDSTCTSEVVRFATQFPVNQGDPIICTLSHSQTSVLPAPSAASFGSNTGGLYLKILFTRADGIIEPRGLGPVEIKG